MNPEDDQRNRIADVIASQQEQTAQPGLDQAQAATAAQGATSQPPPPFPNAGGWGRRRGMMGGANYANSGNPTMGGGPRGMFGGGGPMGGTPEEIQAKQAALASRMGDMKARGMGPPQPGGGMPMGSKGSAADMSGQPAGGMFGGGGGMTPPPASGSSFTGGKGGPVQSFAGGM